MKRSASEPGLSWDRENYIFSKVTKMGFIWPQKRPSYCGSAFKRPAAHNQEN